MLRKRVSEFETLVLCQEEHTREYNLVQKLMEILSVRFDIPCFGEIVKWVERHPVSVDVYSRFQKALTQYDIVCEAAKSSSSIADTLRDVVLVYCDHPLSEVYTPLAFRFASDLCELFSLTVPFLTFDNIIKEMRLLQLDSDRCAKFYSLLQQYKQDCRHITSNNKEISGMVEALKRRAGIFLNSELTEETHSNLYHLARQVKSLFVIHNDKTPCFARIIEWFERTSINPYMYDMFYKYVREYDAKCKEDDAENDTFTLVILKLADEPYSVEWNTRVAIIEGLVNAAHDEKRARMTLLVQALNKKRYDKQLMQLVARVAEVE